MTVLQSKVVDLIRSLVTDRLFGLGDLATEDNRLGAWDQSLEESIQRIRDVYVETSTTRIRGRDFAGWHAPKKGQRLAKTREANRESAKQLNQTENRVKRYVASGAHLKLALNGRRTIVHFALTRPGRRRRPNRQRPACHYLRVPSFDDVNTDGEAVMSARDEVLLRGLIDWVALSSVHGAVEQENPGEPLAVVQDKVLDLIRSLVVDGLFELGDLATPNHRFGAWDAPLDKSIQRIRDVYVNQFDDDPEWWFYCWLDATEKGLKAAEAIEASRDSAQGS